MHCDYIWGSSWDSSVLWVSVKGLNKEYLITRNVEYKAIDLKSPKEIKKKYLNSNKKTCKNENKYEISRIKYGQFFFSFL